MVGVFALAARMLLIGSPALVLVPLSHEQRFRGASDLSRHSPSTPLEYGGGIFCWGWSVLLKLGNLATVTPGTSFWALSE
jgi:hypothetical protein